MGWNKYNILRFSAFYFGAISKKSYSENETSDLVLDKRIMPLEELCRSHSCYIIMKTTDASRNTGCWTGALFNDC